MIKKYFMLEDKKVVESFFKEFDELDALYQESKTKFKEVLGLTKDVLFGQFTTTFWSIDKLDVKYLSHQGYDIVEGDRYERYSVKQNFKKGKELVRLISKVRSARPNMSRMIIKKYKAYKDCYYDGAIYCSSVNLMNRNSDFILMTIPFDNIEAFEKFSIKDFQEIKHWEFLKIHEENK